LGSGERGRIGGGMAEKDKFECKVGEASMARIAPETRQTVRRSLKRFG
jgi:hypothetical protein